MIHKFPRILLLLIHMPKQNKTKPRKMWTISKEKTIDTHQPQEDADVEIISDFQRAIITIFLEEKVKHT